MKVETVKRIFEYENLSLDDPDPTMNPEAVKAFYTGVYPELSQAVIGDVERRGTTLVYPIKRAVGTKGGEKSPPITLEALAEIDRKNKEDKRITICPHRSLLQLVRQNSKGKTGSLVLTSDYLPLLP